METDSYGDLSFFVFFWKIFGGPLKKTSTGV